MLFMRISEQVSPSYSSAQRLEQSLEWTCLFCGVVLVLIWPLAGTIAARNIALVLGCLTGLAWVFCIRRKINLQMALPIACLLAVPAWLWIHYFFLPTDTAAQLYDLKGTWLRVILAVVMASSLGLMVARRPKRMVWIWLAMAALALTTLGRFLLEIWRTHQWVVNDFRFPFKYKSAVVYFLIYPCLLAYALLHYCLLSRDVARKISVGLSASVLAAICWADFIAAHALNGVLVAGFMGMVLLVIYFIHSVWALKESTSSHWLLLGSVIVILATAMTLFWQYDQKYEHKLENLVGDIQVAVQIKEHPQWRRDPQYSGPRNPSDEKGRVINESTYERAAWFVKGVELLRENPLGAGFSHLAFRYFMLQENPNLGLYKTHSGWLDYALGLGLPGVLLTWLAMGLVGWQSLRAISQRAVNTPLALATLWILGGIWLLWWPTEVSEREFIEYLFFMIALFGAINMPVGEYSRQNP